MEGHIMRQTRMTADLHFLFKKKDICGLLLTLVYIQHSIEMVE